MGEMRSNETVILLQVLKHLDQEIQALKSSVTDIANTLERLEQTGALVPPGHDGERGRGGGGRERGRRERSVGAVLKLS